MTFETVTLQVPKPIYQSAWRTARAVKRPVEEILRARAYDVSKTRIPARLRQLIREQGKYRCGYCRCTEAVTGIPLEIEHIEPKPRKTILHGVQMEWK